MAMMRRRMRIRGRNAAAAVLAACAVWSTMTIRASQSAAQVPTVRPAGWTAATHGENGRPDYQRLFGMDTVHELRIVIAPDRFRAMQDDLQSLAPSLPQGFRGMGAGGAGAPGGGGARGFGFVVPDQPGVEEAIKQFSAFAEGATAACSGKAANASCSANGMEGRCTELGPGPLMCFPAAVGDLVAGLGRGGAGPGVAGPAVGGPLSMMTRDPIYVPVTVQHDGRVWTHVGMRYKGNSSLMMSGISGSGKIPFRLDFDRYDKDFTEIEGQRFYGFQKLTFSSNFGDDSQLRELFVTEVFRDRGVPAARAAFYRVFVDSGSGPDLLGPLHHDRGSGRRVHARRAVRRARRQSVQARRPGRQLDAVRGAGISQEDQREAGRLRRRRGRHRRAARGTGTRPRGVARGARGALRCRPVSALAGGEHGVENWDAYGVFAHNYYLYGDPGQQGRLRWIPWDHNLALGADFGGFGAACSAATTSCIPRRGASGRSFRA